MKNYAIAKPITLSPAASTGFVNIPVDVLPAAAWVAARGHSFTNGSPGLADAGSQTGTMVWGQSVDATALITLDLVTAAAGDLFRIFGLHDFSTYGRPKAVKLEWSDDNAAWTQVVNLTGLTTPGTGSGGRGWRVDLDLSAAGSHRYWRTTLTHSAANLHVSEVQFLDAPIAALTGTLGVTLTNATMAAAGTFTAAGSGGGTQMGGAGAVRKPPRGR